MTQENFWNWLLPVAREICPAYGLPPEVCVAQAALESGWGEAVIGEYNLFGRKWNGWGNFISLPTWETENGVQVLRQERFQSYGSLTEAIHDWCVLLTEEPVYEKCLTVLPDRESFVRALGSIYATDPAYADLVLALLAEWDSSV